MTDEELSEMLAHHDVWLETASEGARADLSGENLEGAYLRDANLERAFLTGANLAGADLQGANLEGANLRDANLKGAKVFNASLRGADFRSAILWGSDFDNSDFFGAEFGIADLWRASLKHANLEGANLEDANLEDANLEGANLEDASLGRANLQGANLQGANLQGANLQGANLENAFLEGAILEGANLENANLQGANLEGANLRDANLEDANLEDANLEDANLPEKMELVAGRLASGRKTRALSKLRKQALPLKAGALKRLFPMEFDQIKAETKGADFTPELLESLIRKFGMTWAVIASRYRSDAQRICPDANDVLLLNVDISDEAYTDEQRKQLRAVKQVSVRSGHPAAKSKDVFTVGWVRYCDFSDRILVEEVQSDVGGVRKGLKDPEFVRQVASSGLSVEQIDAAMALMQPFADRFYEDALGLIFDMAEEQGKKVEMLDYAQKKRFGSPRNVYTDLPKSMGMKLAPSEAMPELGQVWTYTPNRGKRRR